MHELTCDEVQYAAPQFALDILDPSARADVAAHLIRCPGCRMEVSDMQESATRLLDLRDVPETGPAGRRDLYFDQYFLGSNYLDDPEGEAPATAVRPARRTLRLVITLAAVAALVVGTALGPELSRPGSRLPVPMASARLLQGDRMVGTVNFYRHHVPAVELAVKGLSAKGRMTCEVVGVDGTVVAIGSFKLYEGSGYWASSTSPDPSRLASFDLVDSAGRVVAVANGQ